MTQILDPAGIAMGSASHPVIDATADAALDINLVANAMSADLALGHGQSTLLVMLGDTGDVFNSTDEIVFYKTADGVSWAPLYLYPRASGSPSGGLYGSPPSWQWSGPSRQILVGNIAGASAVRVQSVLMQTGDNCNVHLRASTGAPEVMQVVVTSLPATPPTSGQVQGTDANGNVPTGKPVLMAGSDGLGVRTLN